VSLRSSDGVFPHIHGLHRRRPSLPFTSGASTGILSSFFPPSLTSLSAFCPSPLDSVCRDIYFLTQVDLVFGNYLMRTLLIVAGLSLANTHTHTHTHTHNIHNTHKNTRTHINTQTHACARTQTPTRAHAHTHTHSHTYIQMQTQTHSLARAHSSDPIQKCYGPAVI
jgi:hypothetical protein